MSAVRDFGTFSAVEVCENLWETDACQWIERVDDCTSPHVGRWHITHEDGFTLTELGEFATLEDAFAYLVECFTVNAGTSS